MLHHYLSTETEHSSQRTLQTSGGSLLALSRSLAILIAICHQNSKKFAKAGGRGTMQLAYQLDVY